MNVKWVMADAPTLVPTMRDRIDAAATKATNCYSTTLLVKVTCPYNNTIITMLNFQP